MMPPAMSWQTVTAVVAAPVTARSNRPMSSSARCRASFLDSRARRPIMRRFSSPVCASSSAAN